MRRLVLIANLALMLAGTGALAEQQSAREIVTELASIGRASVNDFPALITESLVISADKDFRAKAAWRSPITSYLVTSAMPRSNRVSARLQRVYVAAHLDALLSHAQILAVALETYYVGRGCYGVKAAADKLFGKTLLELSSAEQLTLVILSKAPSRYLTDTAKLKAVLADLAMDLAERGHLAEVDLHEIITADAPAFTQSGYCESG